MSRDWRPYEQFFADRDRKRNYGKGMRELTFTWKLADGTTKRNGYPLNKSKDDYPELSFLFSDFESMYLSFSNDLSARKVFERFESALETVENAFLNANNDSELKQIFSSYRTARPIEFDDDMKGKDRLDEYTAEDIVYTWFLGDLDSTFYYNEYNNMAFRDYIMASIDRQRSTDAELSKKTNEERLEQDSGVSR